MSEYTSNGRAMDWDDEVQYTESEFIILPAGEYPFTVTGFDRQNFDGSAKIPPCKMALLRLDVNGGEHGVASVDERLYLHTSMMWKLSEFFTAIGQLQKDGSARMNWNAVPGATGMVKIKVDTYKNKNGDERTNNKVERFLPPQQTAARAQQPPQQTAAPAWGAGEQQSFAGPARGRTAEYQPGKF